MKRLFLLFSLTLLLTAGFCGRPGGNPAPVPVVEPPTAQQRADVPEKALRVLDHIRKTGQAPEGYVGGRVWQNRERSLPRSGRYREYDVNPKVRGKNRGPERLVVDQASGNAWYTPDHYRTFILIKKR